MEYVKLCDSDYRFMCVVWEHAPVNSGELVKLCQEQLGWKKSTTYTVVRKMCEKGYIANASGIQTAPQGLRAGWERRTEGVWRSETV